MYTEADCTVVCFGCLQGLWSVIQMLAVLPQGDMAKSAATCVTLSWLSQSGSLEHKVFIFSKWSPEQSSLSRAWWNACGLPWTSFLSHMCRNCSDLANEQAHMWESVPHSETFPDGHVLLGGLPVCSASPWLRKCLGSALFTVGGAGSHQGPPSCGSQSSGDSHRKAPQRKT